MPFQKGNVANPNGRPPSEKCFADAVRRAVRQPGKDGEPKLKHLADKLVSYALAGEGWAFAQIADRLDGKPHQTSDVQVTRRVEQMTRDELLVIAAGGVQEDAEVTQH